ncbi:MAG TPA: amidohydrolase family protein [Polyangia bacterium]|nr:amidohydrolase family protein [Polyangia bacterium]
MAELVIAHTHLYSALARWIPLTAVPAGDLVEILERIWWRLDRALDESAIRMSARVGIADAVRAGASCLIDHHESPSCIAGSLDLIADEMERAGVRGVVAYGLTSRNGGEAEWRAGLRENERFLRENRRPLVRGLVGVHACFTVPDDALRAAADLARAHHTGLHIHVGEDKVDQDAFDRLERTGALVPGSVYAHAVHLAPTEIKKLAESGGWLVHNPRSNRGNGMGYARLGPAGDRVALGTDGWDGDVRAEALALAECAAAADDPVDVEARLCAGRRLAAEIFGSPPPAPPRALEYDLDEVRACAQRIFERMQELG